MAHPNATQSGEDRTFPVEPPADDLLAASRGRTAHFASTVTGFAEMLAPRRRVVRDPYYGAAMRPDERAPEGDAHFNAGEWAMIVTAGIMLGVVLTLMLAGI